MTVKWIFTDYWETGPTPFSYVWPINPNDGGSPSVKKQMTILQNSGPNRVNIVMEGPNQAPIVAFSGVILHQDQYEAMEFWYDKRVLIKLTDDLNRQFFGIFSGWTPKRVRRASNPWYHTYDAEFTVSAYINASGVQVYGRIG